MMTLEELFEFYMEFPSFSNIALCDVNQKGHFDEPPIELAASRGIIEEIEILINNGADINIQGEHGYTALHTAVEAGHKKVVTFLLENGANIHIKNDNQHTALDLANICLEIGKPKDQSEILEILQNYKE